jgi:hypothetical protein
MSATKIAGIQFVHSFLNHDDTDEDKQDEVDTVF